MTLSPRAPAPSSVDLTTDPVQLGDGVYWVGRRPPGQIFYANPYLVHMPGQDQSVRPFTMVVDPGAVKEFSVISSKIRQIVPNLEHIDAVYINHQDPDVGSSVGMLLGRYCPEARVLCSEDTWRLIQYYNVPRERFVALERFEHGMKTSGGLTFLPVPSPFCHFVGAVMLYEPRNRILFTGDLFGALTAQDAQGIWADDSDWAGMRAFHQLYMPTNKALRLAIARIRALSPKVEILAPQHGRIIRGAYVQEFMERLEHLEVGLDILDEGRESQDERRAWEAIFNRVLETAKEVMGEEVELLLVEDPVLRNHLEFEGKRLVMRTNLAKRTLERAVSTITAHAPAELAQPIKYEAIMAAHELDLPTPNVELEEEGGAPAKGGLHSFSHA